MKYYKTPVGMLAAHFNEIGERDNEGNLIQPEPDDPGMTEEEYNAWRKGVLTQALSGQEGRPSSELSCYNPEK